MPEDKLNLYEIFRKAVRGGSFNYVQKIDGGIKLKQNYHTLIVEAIVNDNGTLKSVSTRPTVLAILIFLFLLPTPPVCVIFLAYVYLRYLQRKKRIVSDIKNVFSFGGDPFNIGYMRFEGNPEKKEENNFGKEREQTRYQSKRTTSNSSWSENADNDWRNANNTYSNFNYNSETNQKRYKQERKWKAHSNESRANNAHRANKTATSGRTNYQQDSLFDDIYELESGRAILQKLRELSLEKNFYKMLGLKNGASQDEIKAKYRLLAKRFHPDLHHQDMAKLKLAGEIFKYVNESYSILSDYQKRKNYETQFSQGNSGDAGNYARQAKTWSDKIRRQRVEFEKNYAERYNLAINDCTAELKTKIDDVLALYKSHISKFYLLEAFIHKDYSRKLFDKEKIITFFSQKHVFGLINSFDEIDIPPCLIDRYVRILVDWKDDARLNILAKVFNEPAFIDTLKAYRNIEPIPDYKIDYLLCGNSSRFFIGCSEDFIDTLVSCNFSFDEAIKLCKIFKDKRIFDLIKKRLKCKFSVDKYEQLLSQFNKNKIDISIPDSTAFTKLVKRTIMIKDKKRRQYSIQEENGRLYVYLLSPSIEGELSQYEANEVFDCIRDLTKKYFQKNYFNEQGQYLFKMDTEQFVANILMNLQLVPEDKKTTPQQNTRPFHPRTSKQIRKASRLAKMSNDALSKSEQESLNHYL